MATSNPKFLPGQDPTVRANAAVTGARFVTVKTGVNAVNGVTQVQHTGAAARAFAVSAYDAAINTNFLCYRAGVVEVTAGAALAHGQGVESDANGQAVVLAAGVRLGTVMADAANGAQALIALELGA